MEILINKSYKQYDRLSRYNPFPYYYHTIDNKYVYGTTSYLLNTTPYQTHIVSKGDTYDSLALHYYNNPTYYWIICDFNRIQDPFNNPAVGTALNIPVISSIKFEVI